MPSNFVNLFCAATRRARINAGLNQTELAEKLGMTRGTYKTYENRSPLPHEFVIRFCMHANITIAELYDLERRLQDGADHP